MNSPTHMSVSFTVSPTAIIEQAQHFFSSENFAAGIEILRSCFADKEVSDEILFSLLKGEIGFNVDKNNKVDFDAKFIKEFEEQAEYSQLISEVLENYDFLIDIDDTKYQVHSSFDFDLSIIATTNDWIKALKDSEGKLISRNKFSYFYEVKKMMEERGCNQFMEAEHILYNKGRFYTFKRYDNALVTEVINVFDTALMAVEKYQTVQNSYFTEEL
jgi:hypothetical protein